MHAVETVGLTKHYGDTKALDGLDLTMPEGSVLGVLGPNGAGKTTAVKILTTLTKPTSGTHRPLRDERERATRWRIDAS
ncbi:MAG: ABC-type multidrug transport system ATPase subunit [Candidatus Aldehydirespiratoraceae bacterium]|jgi:ABC-type multidrug transport system ATPase subunit